MFNRKKIKELEDKLGARDITICELNNLIVHKDQEIHKLSDMIEKITTFQEKLPESCIPGAYCKSCEFAKKFRYSTGVYVKEYYVCGKGNICSDFIQKER